MYEQMIREELARQDHIGISSRWVEAWMRLELGTLDWIDKARFHREVAIATQCICACTDQDNEMLATSLLGVRHI
ncbi:MAG: hypothetical protein WC326_15235 [Candidatus Delongbacteria bacterium]